jgi:uncharacterized protein (TIGR02246 family)
MKVWSKGIIPLLAAALLPASVSPAAAQDDMETAIVEVERSLWNAWKAGDFDAFRRSMAENAVNTGPMGVMAGRDAMVDYMEAHPCEVESFALSDFQVHPLTGDAAILTYRAEQSAVCDGEALPGRVWVSSVYVNENGEWKAAAYHETPAAPSG